MSRNDFRLPGSESLENPLEYEDRRATYRYQMKGQEVVVEVGWWGRGRYRIKRGILLNVSLGGAAVRIDGFPRGVKNVDIRIKMLRTTPWIKARILTSHWSIPIAQTLRLHFLKDCPYEIFKQFAWSQSSRS